MTYKIGATVRLISGGPVMTVNGFAPDGYLRCVWITHEGRPRKATYHTDTLIIILAVSP